MGRGSSKASGSKTASGGGNAAKNEKSTEMHVRFQNDDAVSYENESGKIVAVIKDYTHKGTYFHVTVNGKTLMTRATWNKAMALAREEYFR